MSEAILANNMVSNIGQWTPRCGWPGTPQCGWPGTLWNTMELMTLCLAT